MMLTERLDHHRGRGQQQITVKHVTTNNVTADQAIIADSVTTGGAARGNVASPALLAASSEAPMPILSERQGWIQWGWGEVPNRNDQQPPCKGPMTRLAAKSNRNEQASPVERLRSADVASVGSMDERWCTDRQA